MSAVDLAVVQQVIKIMALEAKVAELEGALADATEHRDRLDGHLKGIAKAVGYAGHFGNLEYAVVDAMKGEAK